MNRRKMEKRSLSWLLVLSMVLSLFGGFSAPNKAKAATGDATISFGEPSISASGYYTYPNVKVTLPDEDKLIHNLTVTVDSGYIKVTSTSIKDKRGDTITGKGILTTESLQEKDETNGGLSQGSGSETLSTDSSSKYETISFDFDEIRGETAPGAPVYAIENYLKTLRFTTSKTGGQTVTITATTLGVSDLKTTINGAEIPLHYYNGHFYGYVTNWCNWRTAYDEASGAKFAGVKGYLATLTSRGEDRFLYSTFPLYGQLAKEGWMGCTRATLESVEAGTEAENLPKITSNNDPNFIWRWVSGPEAGKEFGQQTTAYGFGSGDGGFETFDGHFSNWQSSGNIEPNGGANEPEAFGYYGKYAYGRWNDYSATSCVGGYYIEFGGMPGDDETLKDNLGDKIVVKSDKTEPDIVNPDVKDPSATSAPKKTLTGEPVIKLRDEDADVEVGTRLKADTSNVGPSDATYTYKWYVQDEGTGTWSEIPNTAGNVNLTLTKDTLDHKIKVEVVGTDDYEDQVLSSQPFDATHTKQVLIGTPTIEKKNSTDELEPGTVIQAKLDDLVDPSDPNIDKELHFEWIAKDPKTGGETVIGKDEPSYVIKSDDLGKDIYVKVTAKEDSDKYTGSAKSEDAFTLPPAPTATPVPTNAPTPEPVLEPIVGRPSIVNDVTDEEGNPLNKVGTVLNANIDKITPEGAKKSLIYQWYVRESDGTLTAIDGATEPTLTLTENELNKQLLVAVTGNEDEGYYGTRNSFPYDATQQKEKIKGTVKIINETKAKDSVTGEEYEVKREGTILTADIDGVTPEDSHDTLTYQWYVKESDGKLTPIQDATDRSYTLTTAEVNKEIVVEVKGNGKYKGSVSSNPYDTTRTDSDVKIEDSDQEGKRIIVVSPTMKDTVYAIVDASGDGTPLLDIPTVDEKGVSLYPNVYTTELPGYYRPSEPGGKLIFTVDKDKEYVIYAKKDTKTDVVIVGPEIEGVTIVDYDDKGTLERNDDDTISIEVNPADPGYQYAILNKVDGKYYDMPVEYDPVKKEYVYDKDKNDGFLTTGGEGKVIFSNLPADGTYKVVAIPVGKTIDDEIYKGLKPSQIQGGSPDIISVPKPIQSPKPSESPDPGSSSDPSASATPDPNASATPDPNASATPDPNASTKPDPNASATPDPNASGKPSASPSASASATPSFTPGAGNATAAPLDPGQQSRVDKFVEEHGKNPSTGEIIKKVDDLTKDVVSSGEKEWNQLSSAEQDAVNQRLKDGGCPYTYQELLQMANTYKIPGFKLHKVMKKNSKAKLKLMKCKGATIIVTSTNKKVATVNKKGVIKAKKKGKATLTVTAVKGKYSNRLVINIEVRKKFKNATELKKFKSNRIKTPTILIAKKRKLKKSTKIKIYGLEKNAKVKYISYNKKALPINKKGRYTAKKKGRSLMRVTVKQNDKTYFLYLYVTAFK